MDRQLSPIRFGLFEVDLQAGELRRKGVKIRLQEQPFQVLAVLLERAGEVVTRDELQARLWPADTFVDFDRGLNRGINKLREALGDQADNPSFIETIPKRGYRFVAALERPAALPAEPVKESEPADEPAAATEEARLSRRHVVPWIAAGGLGLIAGWALRRPPEPERPFLQMELDAGPDGFSQPAITADGMRVVFVAKNALAVRRLDQPAATFIPGTNGAHWPFFSPDGKWVGFFAKRALYKVALDGGAPLILCEGATGFGGSWVDDDSIVAGLNDGLYRIPSSGTAPQRLTDSRADPSGAIMHRWPQVLPGGNVLFAAVNGSWQGSLRVAVRGETKVATLIENVTYGRYLRTGYLVYHQGGNLLAAPMRLDPPALTGPPIPLVQDVASALDQPVFDVSANGTLIYRSSPGGTRYILSWIDRGGKTEPVLPVAEKLGSPRISPDGTRVALVRAQEGRQNLWVYHLGRESWTRLTFGAEPDLLPTWTPDGEFLAFRSGNTLSWIRSDGTGKAEHLRGVSAHSGPWSFSADGRWLAFWPLEPGSHLWVAPVERSPGAMRLGQPQLLLDSAGTQGGPTLSPDGRWLAYTSDETGQFEVYVMAFSEGRASAPKRLVSKGGGWSPVWPPGGKQLFYQTLDRRLYVVDYRVTGSSFEAERPQLWFEGQLGDSGFLHSFDVAPDGKRVLSLLSPERPGDATMIRVMLHVDTELRRRSAVAEQSKHK